MLKTKARDYEGAEREAWGRSALTEFDKALDLNGLDRGKITSDESDLQLQKASVLHLMGKIDASKAVYQTLIKQSRSDPKVLLAYGNMLLEVQSAC